MQRNAESSAHRAFTLIELMVVVAIIAILISILVPSLARARQQAMQVKCAANLSTIFKGMFHYMMDRSNGNGYLPQLGWDQRLDGAGFWASQIHRYVKIRRSRVGSKNGLLVCPSDPAPEFRYIEGGVPGTIVTEQDKLRADSGQGDHTRRRGEDGTHLSPLIEPVSYAGSCDTILRTPRGWLPRKWATIKRPHCFVLLAEGSEAGWGCFRWSEIVSQAKTNRDYKRHYGGRDPAVHGSNFLFADGHVQWQSALSAAERMICCMDFGVPVGFTGPAPNQLSNAMGAIILQTIKCSESMNVRKNAITRRR